MSFLRAIYETCPALFWAFAATMCGLCLWALYVVWREG